mgnify:CR=1 FL=1
MTHSPAILDIFVVWHPDDKGGKEVFERLLKHYHSSSFSGLSGGSVEVYSRCSQWNGIEKSPRPLSSNDRGAPSPAMFNVIIPVIGSGLNEAVRNDKSWQNYISKILDISNSSATSHPEGHDPKFYVCPVVLNDFHPRAGLLNKLRQRQFISYHYSYSDSTTYAAPAPSNINVDTDNFAFELQVSQAITQCIDERWNINNPLKIFISHTRQKSIWEERNSSASITERVQEYLDENTKIFHFVDSHTIQTRQEWKNVLKEEASSCAVLMIRTDEYANRRWTQQEVLLAKKADSPIVCLSALTYGEESGCYLLDNVPTVAFHETRSDDSIFNALVRLVDEVLKSAVWSKVKELYLKCGFDWTPVRSPEPATVSAWLIKHRKADPNDRKLWIIHPDPPITDIEWSTIRDICNLAGYNNSTLKILTPREFSSYGGVLRFGVDPEFSVDSNVLTGIQIGVSSSIVEDDNSGTLTRFGLNCQHVVYALTELFQLIFMHGGSIIYGGRIFPDKDNPGDLISHMVKEADRYKAEIEHQQRMNEVGMLAESHIVGCPDEIMQGQVFVNYMPWGSFAQTSEHTIREQLDSIRVDGGLYVITSDGRKLDVSQAFDLLHSSTDVPSKNSPEMLTSLRTNIVNDSDMRILIGGLISAPDSPKVSGTLEEACLTVESHKPLYIAGGYGGVGALLARELGIVADSCFPPIPRLDKLSKQDRDIIGRIKRVWRPTLDGLSKNERRRMALTHRPSEMVSLMLTGITDICRSKE